MAQVVSGFSRTSHAVSAFRRTSFVIALALAAGVVVAGVIVRAQQRNVASASALTPQDYIDIQQLVSSYAYGLDGNTDNGATYASLFAPGGIFGRPRTEGRDNLAALANREPHGAKYVRHFITNHVIEPSPGGAIGREYAVIIDINESGEPGRIFLGGRYDDEGREDAAGMEVQDPHVHAVARRCAASAGRRCRSWSGSWPVVIEER